MTCNMKNIIWHYEKYDTGQIESEEDPELPIGRTCILCKIYVGKHTNNTENVKTEGFGSYHFVIY